VARFLSPEWVADYNAALQAVGLETTEASSVRIESGSFSIEEQVTGVPGRPEADGPLRVVLEVAGDDVSLFLADDQASSRPDVVISLSYDDAAAMSRGDLDPSQALGNGRVRVRGDLAVLVAGQGILARAAARMAERAAETTY